MPTKPSTKIKLNWIGGTGSWSVTDDELYPHAAEWNRIVGSRNVWWNDKNAYEDHVRTAKKLLAELFDLTDLQLENMANAGHVEVAIHYQAEETGYSARLMPWEYILSAATQKWRAEQPFIVTRHLVGLKTKTRQGKAENRIDLLFVESAPGGLSEFYSFESERTILRDIMSQNDHNFLQPLVNPDLAQLGAGIEQGKPSAVHLTAIDAHEGASLMGLPPDPTRWDGIYFTTEGGSPVVAESSLLAQTMVASHKTRPRLVTFNCYFTGARVATQCVAQGAEFAIGFQNTIDDRHAELFFVTFYQALVLAPGKVLEAFREAIKTTRERAKNTNEPTFRGSGVILWSEVSTILKRTTSASQKMQSKLAHEVSQKFETELVDGSALGWRCPLPKSINYASLHNSEPIFPIFEIWPAKPGLIKGVSVKVSLNMGSDRPLEFQQEYDVRDKTNVQVILPLMWFVLNRLKESIVTTIRVDISKDGVPIHLEQDRVLLNPINEWIDSEANRAFLPSFVLSGDRAVVALVKTSRHNLAVLSASYTAGFDGYQTQNEENIDLQVESIWATLAFDKQIDYIEPPPSFNETVQRLRSPSEIIETECGTCIDLALLIAACLEYVGLRSVLFLSEGHAYSGYWRSEGAHNEFVDTLKGLVSADPGVGPPLASEAATQSTVMQGISPALASTVREKKGVGRDSLYVCYDATLVRHYVENGDLVPIETTLLTEHQALARAVEEGARNFKNSSFEMLLDVALARRQGVRPLPLGDGQ